MDPKRNTDSYERRASRPEPQGQRFAIDVDSLESYRELVELIVAGMPIAEAALEGFSDWQVVRAVESLWNAASSASQ